MARERWFYAQNRQRRGPVPLNQLVESVLAQSEPRATLVWRKGFADWTRAEDIPEVGRRIVPFLTKKEEEAAARRAPRPASMSFPAERRAPAAPPPSQGIPAILYGGIAAGVAATGFVAWLLWPSAEPAPLPVPLGGTTAENAPAVVIPGPGAGGPAPAPTIASAEPAPIVPATAPPTVAPAVPAPTPAPAPVAVGDQERELPKYELINLRQVAAWSANTLELTVYNGSPFRVTEIYVTIQRFVGDDVVDDDTPVLLLPPVAEVDAGVATLLNKVAPERAKPGVNPLDTGKFVVGEVGPAPEGFRCEIVSARGYALR